MFTIHTELRQGCPSENLIVPWFCPAALTALLHTKDDTQIPNVATQNTRGPVASKFSHESHTDETLESTMLDFGLLHKQIFYLKEASCSSFLPIHTSPLSLGLL